MLVDPSPKTPEPPIPADAPPSYEDVNPNPPTAPIVNPDQKVAPTPGTSTIPTRSSSAPQITTTASYKGKEKGGWFTFGMTKTAKEVKSTVQGLVRDVVRQPTTSASISILESCAEACAAHHLSFSSLLQEPAFENHPAIYWAIIKRPSPDDFEFLTAVLSHSAPLLAQTMSEIRLACLHVGDQRLFYTLWRSPEFAVLSGPDQMLLGASVSPDSIEIEELAGDTGAFAARFQIIQFNRRMKVSGEVGLEFIARGRIWSLKFHTNKEYHGGARRPGAWAVSLSILQHSPPTWLDSQVVIREPESRRALTPPSPTKSGGPLSSFMGLSSPTNADTKPPISIRLKSDTQLTPPGLSWPGTATALFDDVPLASGLQFPDSAYYTPDGELHGVLEAQLTKPEGPECVIA